MSLTLFFALAAIILPLETFWAMMAKDMVMNEELIGRERNTWIFLFLFSNIFAAIWYYMSRYRDR
jgi:hypothetical protein